MVRLVCLGGVALLGLSCAQTSETVYLRHRETGETVQCGPYKRAAAERAQAQASVIAELRYCVEDFQRQGYERVPASSSY